MPVETIIGVRPHVPAETCALALDMVDRLDPNIVVTVGGGSATGLGKMIALRTRRAPVSLPDHLCRIGDDPDLGNDRRRCQDDRPVARVLPSLVIYDPELTIGLPKDGHGEQRIQRPRPLCRSPVAAGYVADHRREAAVGDRERSSGPRRRRRPARATSMLGPGCSTAPTAPGRPGRRRNWPAAHRPPMCWAGCSISTTARCTPCSPPTWSAIISTTSPAARAAHTCARRRPATTARRPCRTAGCTPIARRPRPSRRRHTGRRGSSCRTRARWRRPDRNAVAGCRCGLTPAWCDRSRPVAEPVPRFTQPLHRRIAARAIATWQSSESPLRGN